MRLWLPLITALSMAAPATAREIVVPVEKGWKHAASGIVLRQPLAGLIRNQLDDSTDGEFDVSANFRSPDDAHHVTIFIFTSPLQNAGVWFQRAVAQIMDVSRYGVATPASPAPLSLIVSDGTHPVGYRQTFTVTQRVKGTAVALAEVGDWLIAVRVSSPSLDAAAVDAKLTAVLSAIGWPAAITQAPAPLPADCADALAFGKAKVVKPDGADVLISAMMPMVAAEAAAKGEPEIDARPLCRDPASTPAAGVYRRQNDRTGYTLALGDAGRSVTVAPSLFGALGGGKQLVSVTLSDVDGSSSVYPSFNTLPKPEQVLTLLDGKAISVSKGGDISLAPDATK